VSLALSCEQSTTNEIQPTTENWTSIFSVLAHNAKLSRHPRATQSRRGVRSL